MYCGCLQTILCDALFNLLRILDNTIRDAVNKNLFGSNFVNSSSESDTQVFVCVL